MSLLLPFQVSSFNSGKIISFSLWDRVHILLSMSILLLLSQCVGKLALVMPKFCHKKNTNIQLVLIVFVPPYRDSKTNVLLGFFGVCGTYFVVWKPC